MYRSLSLSFVFVLFFSIESAWAGFDPGPLRITIQPGSHASHVEGAYCLEVETSQSDDWDSVRTCLLGDSSEMEYAGSFVGTSPVGMLIGGALLVFGLVTLNPEDVEISTGFPLPEFEVPSMLPNIPEGIELAKAWVEGFSEAPLEGQTTYIFLPVAWALSDLVVNAMNTKQGSEHDGDGEIMDIEQAADYLKIKKGTLYRLAKKFERGEPGGVPATKIGGQWRFKKDVLDAMFN